MWCVVLWVRKFFRQRRDATRVGDIETGLLFTEEGTRQEATESEGKVRWVKRGADWVVGEDGDGGKEGRSRCNPTHL